MRLIEDGTYIVDVSEADLDKIKRVMLDTGKHCILMYPDEPEQKTGKWIPLGSRHGWICSECREENFYAYSIAENNDYQLQDFFCPNCGADMRGEDEKIIKLP